MNVLVVFHSRVNTGYAMGPLEKTFFEVANILAGSEGNVYFAFNTLNGEKPQSLPDNFTNIYEIDRIGIKDKHVFRSTLKTLTPLKVDLAFCFDLGVSGPLVKLLRDSGVDKIIAYWGATMSSENRGLKLLLKKLQVAMSLKRPNLFIFESEAMRRFAVYGRGIRSSQTVVIPTGVDIEKYTPSKKDKASICSEFNICINKKIAIYSGHMEERKGVGVIVKAAMHLFDEHQCDGWHILICGNQNGEERIFQDMIKGHPAQNNITFCGYRADLDKLMASSDIGIIASTGWDSFPMSALEMAASGLPILVSDLQGLAETVEPNVTGFKFTPGDHKRLAEILANLYIDDSSLETIAISARRRIVDGYTIDIQKNRLVNVLRRSIAR